MASADDKAPTGLVPRSERKPSFDAKAAVIPVVAIVFASIVLVFALGLVALQSGDSYEIGRQRDLLGNAFRAAAEQVGWELTPQVYWQDAFERVTADDTDWMTNNQNAYLYSLFGYSRIYVLDADDKPISAFEDGAEADPGAFAAVAPALIGPVSEIRTLGDDPAPAVGRIVQEKTAQDGTQLRLVIVGQIESVAGVPSIVVAATIVPDLDASTFTGNPPLLIAVESLDDAFIARMSREFAFAGLTWGPPPSSGWASYTLTSSTGAPVGTLSWIPDRPGTAFVHEITPALVIALLVLFLVATTAVLGTRRFVAAESGSRAKSAFLATMSHEIRTPLNGIAGMIDLLDGPDLNADQHTKLATIRQCSDTLLELINDVLDFSKLEADMIELDLREFDLADAVDAVMGIAATRARAKSLGFVATHPLRKVKTDATRLRQILLNLVGNAVKFTEAGDVRVEVSEMPTRNGVEWLRFAVIDSGIGIAPDRRHRLFQEFSQVDETITRRFGGSGLGLAICAKLTGAMGGKIGVDSEPGKGSTFWFTLPVGRADLSPRLEPIPKRVVLATPSHAVNEQVTTMLVRAGHTVALHPSELSAVDMMLVDVRSLQDGSIAPGEDDLKHTLVFGFGASAYSATAWRAIDGPLTSRRIADALAGKSWDRRARPRNSGPRVGRVLLVEDNRINQEVAAGLLRRMGLTVEIAGDGQQAVDRVAKGELDLVLMDMQMPVMDGLEATRRIRAANGPLVAVPIIGLTANAFVSDKQACLDAGMDGFMPKPINRRKLESIVDQWLPYQAPGEVAGTPTAPLASAGERVAPAVGAAATPADLVDDHQQAALRAEIGQDILDSLVAGFWADADTIVAELKAGATPPEAVGRALHTLKGTAQTLGLAAIARTAAAAEEAFRATAQFDMASIEQAVSRTHAALAVASQPPSDATGKQQGQAA